MTDDASDGARRTSKKSPREARVGIRVAFAGRSLEERPWGSGRVDDDRRTSAARNPPSVGFGDVVDGGPIDGRGTASRLLATGAVSGVGEHALNTAASVAATEVRMTEAHVRRGRPRRRIKQRLGRSEQPTVCGS